MSLDPAFAAVAVAAVVLVAALSTSHLTAWHMVILLAVRIIADSSWVVTTLGLEQFDLGSAVALAAIGIGIGRVCAPSHKRNIARGYMLVCSSVFIWAAVGAAQHGPHETLIREAVRSLALGSIACSVLSMKPAERAKLWRFCTMLLVPVAILAGVEALATGGRASATFVHPNAAGFGFAVCSVAALGLRRADPSRRGHRLKAVFYLLGAGCLATGSMGGVVALAAGVATQVYFRSGSVLRANLGQLLRSVAVAIIGLVIFLVSPLGSDRVSELGSTRSFESVAGGTTTNSLDWRFYNWGLLLDSWRQHPLLGQGLGATIELVQPGRNLPHNEYLRLLVECGLVGFLGSALGVAALVRLLRRNQRAARVPFEHARATTAMAVLVVILINAIAANTLLYTSAAMIAIALLGACAPSAAASRARADGPRITRSLGSRERSTLY